MDESVAYVRARVPLALHSIIGGLPLEILLALSAHRVENHSGFRAVRPGAPHKSQPFWNEEMK